MFSCDKRKLLALLLALLLIAAPVTVYADGTTSIATSGNSAKVGDKVTVTVSGSDSSKLSLRYNNNVLKFQSCSASGYSTEGNVITFSGKSAQITFEATDGGSGDLVVSSDTLSGSSTSVQVARRRAARRRMRRRTRARATVTLRLAVRNMSSPSGLRTARFQTDFPRLR